jgi:photosystem II stability/assembly factor-like uncharacterized protein
VVIDPSTSGTLYVLDSGGTVFKSTDGGANWNPVGNPPFSGTLLVMDPVTTSTFYVVSAGGGVSKSTDGGVNWTALNNGLTDLSLRSLSINPQTPSTLYVGTSGHGVFKSTNGGGQWGTANTGLRAIGVCDVTVDPQNPVSIHIGTNLYQGVQNIGFQTMNGGATWTEGLGNYCNSGNVTVADPQDPMILYQLRFGAWVYKSPDGGATWALMNNGLPNPLEGSTLVIDPQTPTTLYLVSTGTNGTGIYKTTDGAANWTVKNSGLTSFNISSIEIDPQTPATLYVGTWDKGIFKTTNGAGSWTAKNSGLTFLGVVSLTVDPQTPATLYAGTWRGLFKSLNGAGSWSAVTNNGLVDRGILVTAIPEIPNTLYAGTGVGFYEIIFSTSATLDSDGDGMVNSWETLNGLNPNNAADAGLDSDGDGFSNLEEYIGQTNPQSSASVPVSQTVWNNYGQPIRMVTPPGVSVILYSWIDPATLPPSSSSFPYGLIGVTLITGVPGGSATIALTFPGLVDPLSLYNKYGATADDPTDHWYDFSFGSNNGDATITLTLVDGGAGDHDLSANGVIDDPGGPAISAEARVDQGPSGDQRFPWADYNETTGENLVVWQDRRNGSFDDIYGVRLNINGNRIGSDIAVDTASGHQQRVLVKAGGGGYLVVWHDLRNQATNGADIYGRWINGDGTVGMEMAICACPSDQWNPVAGYDPLTNSFLVVWLDGRGTGNNQTGNVNDNYDLYGVVIPAGGSGSLTPFPVVTANNGQRGPQIGYDYGNGRYYLAWNDRRGANYDIYGSRVTASGALLDGMGILISGASGNQFRPTVTDRRPAAGINNHLIAWTDYRNSSVQGDVYGVYVNGSGAVLGSDFAISTNSADQANVVAETDWIRTKKSVVGWIDKRPGTDYDIYSAIVDPSGIVTGEAALVGVPTGAIGEQRAQVVTYATDGINDYGFLTVWADRRNGTDYDIWGTKVWP